MNVLLLSRYPEKIIDTIRATDLVISTADAISLDYLLEKKIDLIVSYGYRHILKEPILSAYKLRIINLHISYLPWNRGANPNFWAWYEQTPHGVSIHYIDAGIDTGPILVQKQVKFSLDHTLDSSYAVLKQQIEQLFAENWAGLRSMSIVPTVQTSRGTFHAKKDEDAISHHFPLGGGSPVKLVLEIGKKSRS